MNSPITGKAMQLMKEKRKLEFRKEEFEIVYQYFLCKDTGEGFVDEAMGNLNLVQVYNAYRSKHKLPFTDEIKRIRNSYHLPATVMSAVLGFGVNQYRLYETGDIPSETNARLIQMAANPDEFLRLVELSGAIEGKQKEKILKRIAQLKEKNTPLQCLQEKMLGVNMPGILNGYKKNTPDIAFHLIRFFSDQISPLKTSLNKLLFYTDFLHFKNFGTGISGLPYRAIQWGPVPSQFDYLFKMAEESNIINLRYEIREGDREMVIIEPSPNTSFQQELFSETELQSMQTVLHKLKGLKTGQLVDLSHQEAGWKENIEGRKIISYQYAFDLLAL